MPPIQTLNFPQAHVQPITDELPSVQQGLGGGAMALQRKAPHPIRGFDLISRPLHRKEREELFGFYSYHMGDIPFWFSGEEYGDIQNPILFGFGDAVRTEFFLPNNHLLNGTTTIYENAVVEAGVTITDVTGMVTFTTAPALDAMLTATYQCRFKVFIEAVNQGGVRTERIAFQAHRITMRIRVFLNG